MPLWQAFCRLSRARGGGFGAQSVTYTDMQAFCRLSGVMLKPWQVEIIEQLDGMWLEQQAEKHE